MSEGCTIHRERKDRNTYVLLFSSSRIVLVYIGCKKRCGHPHQQPAAAGHLLEPKDEPTLPMTDGQYMGSTLSPDTY